MFGSLAAFFIPLTIMMVIYLLTVQVLRKKVFLLKSRVTQRLSHPALSTVFQREQSVSPPHTEQMFDFKFHWPQEKCTASSMHPSAGEDVPIRRMSTMGKKSMQTLSNEQRASKVLGIVFLLFVVMWCPFFITNITSVLCTSCDVDLIARLMEIFVWVGYVSSGINPLVYTLFNKTFREAFARYITCQYKNFGNHGQGRQLQSSTFERTRTQMSFQTSVAQSSKLLMKHGIRNGIGAVGYSSPLRCRQVPAAVVLDTMLLTENAECKHEEHVSSV